MQKYNIALLPVDSTIQETFSEYAQRLFARNADEYLLGKDALAHITLTQFMAANDEIAKEAFRSLQDKSVIEIHLTELHLRHVQLGEDKRIWVEFFLAPNQRIIKRQREAWEAIAQLALLGIHHPDMFVPHLSIARVNGEIEHPLNSLGLPIGLPLPFKPVLGQASERGMFVRQISP